MEEFVKKVEELGKKFNAELYGFEYNCFEYNSYEGVRIKSDWDVQFSKSGEKFEEGRTILDLMSLGNDSSVANNEKICKIHIYYTVNDEDYQSDFFVLEILDKPNRSGVINVTCTIKAVDRREEDTKIEKTFLRKEFECITSWEELVKIIRKTL